MKKPFLLALCLSLAAWPLCAHEATQEMTQAATNFLSTLTPEQKAKASFDFAGDERSNWHFIPRPRKGLPIKEMTQEQRLVAYALLSTGLSNRGYSEAVSIMSLEAVLAELEKGKVGGNVRDPENYFFSIFGTPGGKEVWGWRVEGHHLSLNFTAPNTPEAAPSMTPSFFGTNPGEVRQGPRTGTRVLSNEEELGRTLVKSLTEDQRKVAILPIDAPKEILNVPTRTAPSKPEGIPYSQLTPAQAAQLVHLIKTYIGRHRPDVAAEEYAKIEKAGLDKISFAWAGGLERGMPHYYRVQSSAFVFEYDNTQNDANHVHSIWRDMSNDFGADLLRAHIAAEHSGK